MTNVPDPVREIWTEMYKLFDRYYKMENEVGDWKKFWDEVEELYRKHGKNVRIRDMALVVADMIGDCMKAEGRA